MNKKIDYNARNFSEVRQQLIEFIQLECLRKDIYWEILTCTGMQNRQKVAKDKIAWIRDFVNEDVVVTCTFKGVQKAAFAKEGYILIDDTEKNIVAWNQAGGTGILFKDTASCINELKTLL